MAGTSVVPLVGAAYASGQPETLEAWVRQLSHRDVWRLLDTTFRGGGVMMTGNHLMRAIGRSEVDRVAGELRELKERWASPTAR